MNSNAFGRQGLKRRLALYISFSHRPPWVSYCFAVAATAIMLAVRLGITVNFGERPLLILFILPIILSAALGGLGPGLVATLLSGISAAYFMPPAGRFAIALPYDIFQWCALIVDGVLVSILSDQLHRARHRSEMAVRQQTRATAARRESEEGFRLLVHAVTEYSIILLDPPGRITSWNEGARRIKGYDAEEIIGQHFSRFYTREDVAAHKPEAGLKAAADTGKFEEVGLRIRKDGSQFWANVIITPIRDSTGILRGFSKVTRDISERKRQDDIIKEHNELLTRKTADLEATLARVKRLEGMLSICMQCKKIRTETNDWDQFEKYIGEHSDAVFSHGICPECLAEQMKKMD